MRYLLMIGGEDNVAADAEELCGTPDTRAWVEEMKRRRVFVSGELLQPPADARTVRVRHGDVLVTDGPFVETKEQIGGLTVIECADLEEAIAVASAHPMAGIGMIEVRPLLES